MIFVMIDTVRQFRIRYNESMLDVNQAEFWQALYQNGQTPWDLAGPTPVFARLAQKDQLPPGQMIVLGAGRGYDARLFARYGHTVTAVDFADEAIQAMHALSEPEAPINIVQADFFWLPPDWNGRFDTVLDYTSFCAISPDRRSEYADLVTRLLRANGRYVILAYPIGKRPGGPPYVVQPDAIIELFTKRGFRLQHRESPTDSIPERRPHEELLILQRADAPNSQPESS